MKMEVLSVQNQFQGQFGVIGSNKIKDWTSPLTPPRSSDDITSLPSQRNSRLSSSSVKSSSTSSSLSLPSAAAAAARVANSSPSTMTTAASATSNPPQFITSSSLLGQDDASLNALSLRLQDELRAAKSRHLACTEVLLPADLLQRVAAEMIKVSEKEPCGIRGCSVYIEFEDEPSNTRRIASMKVDPSTVSTFELYLTLKHDKSGWTSILPQFLKNLARSSTIMISPEFTLTKNKLYHSFSD
ncbi:unnamed protein product [Hermetia illucens]|uniref:Uncharacterized protein n=1 Tax=Hermetia illucens TaxID=343691 RepID=A0A7R8UIS9_HERIL|nr:protein charybde-like [Hermetia illucens]CAD7081424.1 unnamed protein product [Hermetia illucens]